LICCTHTHTGAQTGDDDYTRFVVGRIGDAIRLAWQGRKPAQVGWATALEDRVVFNRRFKMKDGPVRTNPGKNNPHVVEPAGPIDPEAGALVMREPSGQTIGLLANYTLHYVGGGEHDRAVSADYFGFFSQLIQRMRGERFVAALSNGACGDINNVDAMGTGPTPNNERYQHTERVAGLVAAAALWAWDEMAFGEDVQLGAALEEVALERKAAPTEQDLARAGEVLKMAQPTMAQRAFALRVTERMAGVPETVRTWVQVLRVGGLALVALPGEVMVELGLEIKRRSPFEQTMVLELANDYVRYIPTRAAYEEGGYEPEASLLRPGSGEKLVEAAVRLLNAVHSA
jgi:hypothetical protein